MIKLRGCKVSIKHIECTKKTLRDEINIEIETIDFLHSIQRK